MMAGKRLAVSALTLAILSGCTSTGPTSTQQTSNEAVETAVVEKTLKGAYGWNKRIENLIHQGNVDGLAAGMNFVKGARLLGMPQHEKTPGVLAHSGAVEQVANGLAKGLGALTEDVSYRYSEDYSDCCYVSHYHVVGDKMFDFDLYIEKQSGEIIDYHELPYQYSALQMVIENLNLSFEMNDSKNYVGSFAFGHWQKTILSYQQGKLSSDEARKAFDALPQDLKQRKLIFEHLVKAAVSGEKNEQQRQSVLASVVAYHPNSPVLEGHYFVAGDYDSAVGVLLSAAPKLSDTYVMQAELAAVYTQAGKMDKALEHAFNALYQEPEKLMSYIFVLMASFHDTDHQLTDQTLDVIDAKWDNVVDKAWLGHFSQAKSYLDSGAFGRWQQRRQK